MPFTFNFKNAKKYICGHWSPNHVILTGPTGPTRQTVLSSELPPISGYTHILGYSYLSQGSISKSEDPVPFNPGQEEILRLKDRGDVDHERTVEAFWDGDDVLPDQAGPAPLRVLDGDVEALRPVRAGPGGGRGQGAPCSGRGPCLTGRPSRRQSRCPAHGGDRKQLSTMTRVRVDKATFPHIVIANHGGDGTVFHAACKESWAYCVAPEFSISAPQCNPGSQEFD